MTIANDGEQHLFLTLRDEQPVAWAVAIVGQIMCAACGTVWQAGEMHDLDDLVYARDFVQAVTTWAALNHAKTCTRQGSGDQHSS